MSKRPHPDEQPTPDNFARAEVLIETARKAGASDLWLIDLGLTTLPESIGQLSQLQELSLSNNGLTTLPESIVQLSQLRELYLDNNELTMLPESIVQLSQLQVLYLDDNGLTTLPESLKNLKQLKRLYLHGNEALRLPAEVLGPEWKEFSAEPANPGEILQYYFRARGGERRPLNEAKLILVGRGAVGKTSIVNRLVHKMFTDEKKTEGIKITEWPLVVGRKKDKVRLNVWDFGGQEIMHATHQFFLTERSLYLLVLSGREGGEDAEAEYWLKLIQSFGGDSPVVVVLNKIKEHPFDVNRSGLKEKYPFICEFVRTDCKSGVGITELRRIVERETDRLEHLRDAFPASWFSIKDRLAAMSRLKKNYLSFDEYRRECARLGEEDPKAQESLAFYLHSLGIALNYKDDLRLKDTHVLNPHWVTNGIYKILNASRLEKKKGEISLRDLSLILDKRKYPTKMHRFLLDLMKKFELCFSLPGKETDYLIPELLSKQEPKEAREFKPEECLNFQYQYPILPEGLLPRFIVRTHVLSDDTPRWRTGVILNLEENLALVKADPQEKFVFINIQGPVAGRRRLLSIIRANFDRIHTDIRKLRPAEIVPLPGRPGATVLYEELLAWEKSGTKKFQKVVDESVEEIDVNNLLNGVEVKGEREATRERKGIERRRAARIFVSYSHKDERFLSELKTHLSPLRRLRLIETWDDREIEAGEDWREKINDSLESADIIILLISAYFIDSDYCYGKEMTHALARHKKKETVVVPAIVRDANWKTIPRLKGLEALPKNAKPVLNWPNKHTAWRDVSERVQKMIEACATPTRLGGADVDTARTTRMNPALGGRAYCLKRRPCVSLFGISRRSFVVHAPDALAAASSRAAVVSVISRRQPSTEDRTMRPIFRPCFVAVAALFFVGLFCAQEARAQAVGPHDVLISEFRLSGPGGDSDEFIEFYCNRDTDCDISDFVIQAHDPSFGDFTTSFPDDTVIPARQYLLVGDSSEYSLSDYATLDFDVSSGFDFFIDNEGLQLLAPDETVIDSVGFIGGGNAAAYIEGTGLQPATDARPADQYSYVRKRTTATNGLPQDTDNNAEDFVLVSVTGTAHPGITAPPVLGAPGPQGLDSPPSYDKTQFPDSLVEPSASPQTSPNRVRTGSGDSGTLSIRRTVTNNTDQAFDYISFRVIEIPTLNSPQTISGQAELRLVTSDDAETFMNSDGRTVTIRGTIVEFDPDADTEPSQPQGGGLNSTVHVNLGPEELILPGETVDVQFLLNVVHAGNYRFFLYVEAFPTEVPAASPSHAARVRSLAGKTALSPVAPRRLVGTKPGAFVTPFGSQSKKTLKKPLAMPLNAPPPATHKHTDDPTTRRTTPAMPGRTPPALQGGANVLKPGRTNAATPPAPADDDADGARPKRSSILSIQKNN